MLSCLRVRNVALPTLSASHLRLTFLIQAPPGMPTDGSRNSVVDYVCGCLAGGANVLTGYPFDTVKVALQASQRYSGPLACATGIYKSKGVRVIH